MRGGSGVLGRMRRETSMLGNDIARVATHALYLYSTYLGSKSQCFTKAEHNVNKKNFKKKYFNVSEY